MTKLKGRIDFVLCISVQGANPNGDPMAGNYPRLTAENKGEISDVALKRKIRNRWQDEGEEIFVFSKDRDFANHFDGYISLKDRFENNEEIKKLKEEFGKGGGKKSKNSANSWENISRMADIACRKWMDVRSFGQVLAIPNFFAKDNGLSLPVRGPVTISHAVSLDPVLVTDMQITKCVPTVAEDAKADNKKSDTMGRKYTVDFGVYVAKGSVSPQLAEKNGFTQEDAEKLKQALLTLFENDMAAARPVGSMEVAELIWWEHDEDHKVPSPSEVFRSVHFNKQTDSPKQLSDYEISVDLLPDCVEPQIFTNE